MPLNLTFSKNSGGQLAKGPFSSVRFEGERIRDGESGGLIGTHLPHGWRVDGEDYLRLDVAQTVVVTWDGHGPAADTTGHFSSINGVAYIDRRILAFVDRERNDWYMLREGLHHAAFTIAPA